MAKQGHPKPHLKPWQKKMGGGLQRHGMAKTLHLLQQLLHQQDARIVHAHEITRLIRDYGGTSAEFLDDVLNHYVEAPGPVAHPSYTGQRNAELDEYFSTAEVMAVVHRLNTKSAPGPDGINNNALRILDKPMELLTG